jgi:hypothetical protein
LTRLNIILSSTYCANELVGLVGQIPVVLLPLGNQLLLDFHLEAMGTKNTLITLPSCFALDSVMAKKLNDVTIKYFDPESDVKSVLLSLVEEYPDADVNIAFGDTLIDSSFFEGVSWPCMSARSEQPDSYNWVQVNGKFVCGVFRDRFDHEFKSLLESSECIEDFYPQRYNNVDDVKFWYDFGRRENYLRNRQHFVQGRFFNQISVSGNHIEKRSADVKKINAEVQWFGKLPEFWKVHTPHCFQIESGRYFVEYKPYLTASELASLPNWPVQNQRRMDKDVCRALCSLHAAPTEAKVDEAICASIYRDLFSEKLFKRIEDFEHPDVDKSLPFFLNGECLPSVMELAQMVASRIPMTEPKHVGCGHGDPFYGNILYDNMFGRVIFIDPRGFNEQYGICIDTRYDWAKFEQSRIGCYDEILSGSIVSSVRKKNEVEFNIGFHKRRDPICFDYITQYDFSQQDLKWCLITLFLSMLPLHADDNNRQMTFLANAYDLFVSFGERE